ncbi:MAG: DNA-3-methyladenine glycosylase family protein [Alphaproteobacteria bacterium]
MPPHPRIRTRADLEAGLAFLTGRDERLARAAELAGELPLRLRRPGFAGLMRIMISQQVSTASAEAIWRRVEARFNALAPKDVLASTEEELRALGLSRPKAAYARAFAEHAADGRLNLAAVARMDDEAAIEHMQAVPGIGRWTAEIYLLFCLGRPDVLPSGDLALQTAFAHLAGLPARPGPDTFAAEAAAWAPWRGVAARLLWAYYRLT